MANDYFLVIGQLITKYFTIFGYVSSYSEQVLKINILYIF